MDRIKMTNDEKFMTTALGTDVERATFNMAEANIDELIDKEKSKKFNEELEKYEELLENKNKETLKAQENLNYDINDAEIRSTFSRVLIKPFKVNPFTKMEVKNGIIVDAGGYNPHIQLNPMSGKYEEQEPFIITGCIIETGPDVKYLKEGDVVYYRRDTAVPIPFLGQGLVSIDEKQIITVVNVGLSDRFKKVKEKL